MNYLNQENTVMRLLHI